MKKPSRIICLIVSITFLGCSFYENKKANKLYVEASLLMQQCIDIEKDSYSKALELCKKARELVARITLDYPSSDIAVQLLSGQASVTGFSVIGLYGIESSLKDLVDAEQHPFACALLATEEYWEPTWSTPSRASNLCKIAMHYAKSEDTKKKAEKLLDEALEDAQGEVDSFYKFYGLLPVADGYARIGRSEKALQLLEQARSIAEEMPEYSKHQRLADLARKYAEAGYVNTAEKLLNRSIQTIKTNGNYITKSSSVEALVLISEIYSDKNKKAFEFDGNNILNPLNNKEKALQVLDQGLEIANNITDHDSHLSALVSLTGGYAKAGQKEKSSQLLAQALTISKMIEKESRDSHLEDIANKYAEIGHFTRALETVEKIRDRFDKIRALIQIADNFSDKGQTEKAIQVLNQGLEIAKKIDDYKYNSRALAWIAGGYIKTGEKETALELLSSALKMSKMIGEKSERDYILETIANHYVEVGQLIKALEVAESMDLNYPRANVLIEIADGFSKSGETISDEGLILLRKIVRKISPTQEL